MAWGSKRLDEIATIQTGPFGSQLHQRDYVDVGTPIITVEHLGQYRIKRQNMPMVTSEDASRLQKYSLLPGDIVFSRVGSVDQCSYVGEAELGWLFSGRCLRVRPDASMADPLFIYYSLNTTSLKNYIRAIAVGATMPSINTAILSEVPISVPALNEQQRIASVLGSFDNKIVANNEVVSASNELIRNLYRTLPASSRSLNDVASLAKNNEQPHQFLPDKRLVGLEHFDSRSLWLSRSSTPDTATSTKTKFQAGDTLFGKLRPYFHKVAIAPFDGYCSTDILVLRAKNPLHSPLVATAANSDAVVQQAVNSSNGTRMPRAKWNDIEDCPIPDPAAPATLEFIDFAGALIQDATARLEENQTLAKTRDELLPLLMSGKITVREAGQEAAAAGAQVPSEENEV